MKPAIHLGPETKCDQVRKPIIAQQWALLAQLLDEELPGRRQTPPKRDTIPLDFRPDNMRWAPDGSLLVAGQGGSGQTQTTRIVKINPETLRVTDVETRPNTLEFSGGTVAIQVGRELWIGSYRGDRLAIVPTK